MSTSASYAAQPDLSVYLAFTPETLLPFWYGQSLFMPLSVWQELQKQADLLPESSQAPCRLWVQLVGEKLQADEELLFMETAPSLHETGPFYYLPDKVCFYFPRYPVSSTFNAQEFMAVRSNIESITAIDPLLQKSLSQRSKTTKKTGLQPEELKKEIQICMKALSEREHFQQQAASLKDFIALCSQARTHAASVGPQPQMLKDSAEPGDNTFTVPAKKSRLRKKWINFFIEKPSPVHSFHSHKQRQYLVALKNYEKACVRYKEARESWPAFHPRFCEKVSVLEKACENRHMTAEKNIRLCGDVLNRSIIHELYQEIPILESFLSYLETGRACHLQSCINLYEEEQHWKDLKNSQHRIENTILSWQPDPGSVPVLDSETMNFLHSIRSMISKDA